MKKYKNIVRLIFVLFFITASIACNITSLQTPQQNPITTPVAHIVEDKPTAVPQVYPADWILLLSDGFDDNGNEWSSPVPDDASGSIRSRVENGTLDVTLSSNELGGARNSVMQTNLTHLLDFYITFEANQTDFQSEAYYGLEFRTISVQGYVFMIDQKNRRYTLAFTDSDWHPIIDFTTSTAINRNAPNKIGLLIMGPSVTMFINDQEIAKISDARPYNMGTFGFTAGLYDPNGNMSVSFDNLEIYGSAQPQKAPTLAFLPSATHSPRRNVLSMTAGAAVLQDQLLYMRSTSEIITAIPQDPADAFLVTMIGLASNSTLAPQDLAWTALDDANQSYDPVGICGLQFVDNDSQKPMFYTFFGKPISGSITFTSDSDLAMFGLVFVVPKEIGQVTLVDPRNQEFPITIFPGTVSVQADQIPDITFDFVTFETVDGSEDWTITP